MTARPPRSADSLAQDGSSGDASGVRAGASSERADASFLFRIGGLIKTMRPHQWVKNVFVLAPVFFAKDLFKLDLIGRAALAFFIFCLLAGAVYTINDIVDAPADRIHPVKRHRPIASGRVPLGLAKASAVALVVVSLATAFVWSPLFGLVALAYFLLNVAYSFRLKKIAYLDVVCIALGFVLRVVAGGISADVRVSAYLLACTALLALFLGFGKRRHELASAEHGIASKQREALEAYTSRALTVALAVTGTAAVATYIAYTLDPATMAMFQSERLWLTTPFVLFGVVRFLQLVASRPKAESPTQEMLRDVPFVVNLVLWVAVVFWIVYQVRPAS